ncbi:hypothetical protein [Methanolobus sp. ZRKC5]|uniref:hypothetical protein n=1 Tax=unclassified Methanolobus TaxID=2629569 RepID=UPI00313DE456
MAQTTVQNSNAIRFGSGKLEIGTSIGSLVNIGAIRNAVFKEEWEDVEVKSDNAGIVKVGIKEHVAYIECDMMEVNLENLNTIRGDLDAYATVAGTPVSVTDEAHTLEDTDFVRLNYRNGDGTEVSSIVVTDASDTAAVRNTDYVVAVDSDGYTCIARISDSTVISDAEGIKVDYSYTPSSAATLTSGGKTAISDRVVRITNSVNHTYGTTNSQTFIGFQGDDSSPQAYLNSMILTYYLWVDSSGFALMAKPEPVSVDDRQSSFITVVEHMGTKEYSDGLTNFYCFTQRNVGVSWTDSNDHDYFEFMPMIRPFAYETRTIGQGIQFWYHAYNNRYALKSTGNGKVYFVKPVICNSIDNFTPIYQSELFFKFSEDAGLVDGDVIAIDGETTKYICKALDSPDSTARLNFAIKYVA